MSSSADLATGFSVLRLSVDPLRGVSIPVGAVVWDADREWYKVRVIHPTERVVGITPERRLLVEYAERQLTRWANRKVIPYMEEPAEPWSSAFWEGVQKALTTGVQLDDPKAMEPITSMDEVDLLFEAVVQPGQRSDTTRNRMEGALSRALSPYLAKVTKPRLPLPAFHAAQEHVMRGVRGETGVVVLEAVNLAGKHARRDADALVSRLMRIREGLGSDERMHTIIGYMASPGGLNGETHMRDWIAEQVTESVFDLNRERESLNRSAIYALESVNGQNPFMY